MAEEKLADKKYKKGKQSITTSIFNWSKDYATAASEFDEACNYKIKQINYIKKLEILKKQ